LLKQVAERRSTSEVDIRVLWANVCAGRFYSLAAHHAELGIMRELGFSLGASDRDDQIKHLRLATQQLASLAETAQSEQQKYESMWRSLGVLGGSLLVVLMV
jgi:stage III sporulation protein AB